MTEQYAEVFMKIGDLGFALGMRNINQLAGCWEHQEEDYAFIAAIRNAAPRLLQHVRDQQAIEMGCPSPEDIAEWLKFVNGMILIAVVHVGESEPIPRLVAVSDWLERLAARAKEE